LIQASNAAPPDASLENTKKAMVDKHVGLIRQAAEAGAQIVCLQEIFYGPYFCAEQIIPATRGFLGPESEDAHKPGMAGVFWAESEPGKRSIFFFTVRAPGEPD